MSDSEERNDESELSQLLCAIGFIRGNGFDGEVWTNCESLVLEQVWIYFSGEVPNSTYVYDATSGFDFKKFFAWWEALTRQEIDYNRCCST